MGLLGRKIDLIDHYEKKLGDVEEHVRTEQSSVVVKVAVFKFLTSSSSPPPLFPLSSGLFGHLMVLRAALYFILLN